MTAQLPVHLQNLQTPDIASSLSANLGSAMPPHVSIGGGRFTLIDAGNNEIPVPTFDPTIGVYLDACIVDVNEKMSRIYFAGSYDPSQEGTRPDCFSDNGIAPSISAASPQAHSCMPDPTGVNGCKWAVWGSKINANGKGVPACSSKQKIALLIPGFQTLFLLAVPPNSHGPLREYVEKAKASQVNIADVITRISFVPGVQGTLQFYPAKMADGSLPYIDAPTAQLRQAAYAEKKTDTLVGRNDVPRPVGAIAGPATANQPAQPAPAQIVAQPVQVQQPGPFTPSGQAPTTPPAAFQMPSGGAVAAFQQPAAATPSDPAPTTRRRRRTAADMAAGASQGQIGQAPAQPAAAPVAPFPHPGQAAQPAPGQPGNTAAGSFGIAQPAAADPALSNMLDDFFKQG